jgi:hypothetical protein
MNLYITKYLSIWDLDLWSSSLQAPNNPIKTLYILDTVLWWIITGKFIFGQNVKWKLISLWFQGGILTLRPENSPSLTAVFDAQDQDTLNASIIFTVAKHCIYWIQCFEWPILLVWKWNSKHENFMPGRSVVTSHYNILTS